MILYFYIHYAHTRPLLSLPRRYPSHLDYWATTVAVGNEGARAAAADSERRNDPGKWVVRGTVRFRVRAIGLKLNYR